MTAGEREAYDKLASVLQAALASDADPEDTPLVVRLRERLATLDQDPRWPTLQRQLGQLRDVQGPPAGDVEQLAQELAGILPGTLSRTTWPMRSCRPC